MKALIVILSILIINSCSSTKNKNHSDNKQNDTDEIVLNFKDGPQVIIYKTRKDYSKFVPVILSDDKSKIISYPHPSDLKVNGKLSYPTQLKNGYLLDNRGINENVAFLNIKYDEYNKMKNIPTLKKLYSMILDKDPLVEIYNCGNKFSFNDLTSDLNKLIIDNKLKKCKCLTKNKKK